MTKQIPIVDLQSLYDVESVREEDPKFQDIAESFGKALHEFGFAYLINHGIPEDVITNAFEGSREFFDLPLETKLKYKKGDITKNNHGYTAMGQESLTFGKGREIKESFCSAGTERFYPDETPWLKESNNRLEEASIKLVRRLLKLLGMSIKLENTDVFNESTRSLDDPHNYPGVNTMRSLQYAKINEDEVQAGDTRCAEHTDYGLMTLVFQDDIGGLQVKNTQNEWVDATPIPNTIVVNTGDLLDLWTCGYFPATLHRVIIPESELQQKATRQSIIFFTLPDNNVSIWPLRSEVLNKEVDFEPVNSFEWIMRKHTKAHAYAS